MSRLGRRTPNRPHVYGPASYNPVTIGNLNVTLAPFTSTGSTAIAYPIGQLAKTLPPFTLTATATHDPTLPKVRGTIWTKTLTGAGGSETFTASAVDEAALAFIVLHGAQAVDVSASATGNSDQADSPSVTTTAADEMVLWAHFRDAHVVTVTPGTGTTVGPLASSANAVRASVAANFQTQAVAGASGTRRFAGAAADNWVGATISVTGIPAGLIIGNLNQTLAPFTLSATATFQHPLIVGNLAVTLAPFTLTATAIVIGGAPTTPTLRGELSSFPRVRKGFSAPRLD